jgi:serine protease inhibitor
VPQVCVVVDEEGTEAAAVTAMIMMRCTAVMAAAPVVIKLDR